MVSSARISSTDRNPSGSRCVHASRWGNVFEPEPSIRYGAQGERTAGEPDHRYVDRLSGATDRLADEGQGALDVTRRRAPEVAPTLQGGLDERSALRERNGSPEHFERQQDVGEDDRRINPQLGNGHRGHRGRSLGGSAQLEEAETLADRPVAGQVPSGLAEDPYRVTFCGPPTEHFEEDRVHLRKPSLHLSPTSAAGPYLPESTAFRGCSLLVVLLVRLRRCAAASLASSGTSGLSRRSR